MKLIKRIAFGSAGLLVLLMMAATVVEKLQGTGTAWTAIYGSPFFTILWGILAVCALVYLISRRMQRDFFTFLLHIAFLVILAGALTTRLCGKQGSIHLRMNDTPVSAFVTSGTEEEPLPFDVRLHDFRIDYYKGSFAPMDFTSRIRIEDNGMQAEGEVSMNRIFTYLTTRGASALPIPDMLYCCSLSWASFFRKTACSAGFSVIPRCVIKPFC